MNSMFTFVDPLNLRFCIRNTLILRMIVAMFFGINYAIKLPVQAHDNFFTLLTRASQNKCSRCVCRIIRSAK